MTLYSGICEGGPYHGKRIHHGLTSIKVAMQGPKVVTWFGPSTDTITVSLYVYRKGKWIWEGTR